MSTKSNWKIFDAQTISADLRAKILSEMALQWPAGFSGNLAGRDWIHPEDARPQFLVIFDYEQIPVAFCSIMHKEMSFEGQKLLVNGLSGVLVFGDYRSKGFGLELLKMAELAMSSESVDLSVLSCGPELVPYYQRIGLEPLDCFTLLVGSKEAPDRDPEPFMAKARTPLGERVLDAWKGHSVYFGEYSW